ncbi:hypothetical protein M408DRAFT_308375 [Serendipita vermifera MAFF 305830]|uniref:VIT domain-containing protein n=1 Tax=Serendipita vermifera MAFF 305830 TaxID=933852 RepID=A0A0C3BAH0_SERVB|nr:hypothetical protein M408DRAFT_308375 [Serendipita vermifera MAFF 305830]
MHSFAGLMPMGIPTFRTEYPLVSSRCHYKVLDVYTIAEVVQEYHANSPHNRDIEYVFPLPPSAAVCSFKAILDNVKVIKGIVKEREEAKHEYYHAVAQGKTAGLLQQEHADVFRVSLGNVKPKQTIKVYISFVSIVPHDGNSPESLRITMPVAIAPRYGVAPTLIPWLSNTGGNRFELTVAVQMSKPITSVSSPSHLIRVTLGSTRKRQGDHDPAKAFVNFGDSAFLDKDIILVVSAQDLDVPRCTVERWLQEDGAQETTDAYALTMVPKFDLPTLPKQEYIFLIDRSGSMQGERIASVKTALQIMLRSLPSDNTLFNLVSFGSHHNSLWFASEKYTEESMAQASRHVDTISATYGGTELRSALKYAFNQRSSVKSPMSDEGGCPASVFILTDGEAWDLNGVVDVVQEHAIVAKQRGDLLRTFVLGVGNQVSTAMCEGIARAGSGIAVFVAAGEQMDTKLMSLLRAARGGVIEDLTIDWGAPLESIDVKEKDGFGMVSKLSEKEHMAPQAGSQAESLSYALPPLGLFDKESSLADNVALGPKKAILTLPPPPIIQQAPKSDKLPIPLYPGFRCSIFAIIKQPATPGPFSRTIKITGKVLGRSVEFVTPVVPISISHEEISEQVGGIKLLHTLAAEALIQIYEDMKGSPESRAQIERLGTRYSLASSVTSFVAIEQIVNGEARPTLLQRLTGQRDTSQASGLPSPNIPMRYTDSRDSNTPSYPAGRYKSSAATPLGSAVVYAPPVTTSASVNYSTNAAPIINLNYYGGEAYSTTRSPTSQQRAARARHNNFTETYDPTIEYYDPTIEDSDPTGYVGQEEYSVQRRYHHQARPTQPTVVAPQGDSSPAATKARSASIIGDAAPRVFRSLSGLFSSRKRKNKASISSDISESVKGPPPPSTPSASTASRPTTSTFRQDSPISELQQGSLVSELPPILPPTLETIARAQKFDGSFPNDFAFIRSMFGTRSIPAVPQDLELTKAYLNRKADVWATILVLAYLRHALNNQQSSWEMMAAKATRFVQNSLLSGDTNPADLCSALIDRVEKVLQGN